MPINEYTTSMRKAIHRAMKVGKREILRVIRVDREKGISSEIQVISICQRSKLTWKMRMKENRSTLTRLNFTLFSSTSLSTAKKISLSSIKNTYGLSISKENTIIHSIFSNKSLCSSVST